MSTNSKQGADEMVTIRTVCPKCHKLIVLKIPKSKLLESEGGITVIPYEHGDPPHLLVMHVDIHGDVRGSVVYEGIIREEKKEQEELLVNIMKKFDIDTLSTLAYWVIAGKKIRIKGSNEKLVKAAEIIVKKVLEGEVVDVNRGDAVDIDLDKLKKPNVNIEPLRKIFRKIFEPGEPGLKLEWVKRELDRLREGLKKIEEMYLAMKKIKKEDLLSKFGEEMSYIEMVLLVNILREKGYNVIKKFDLKELKLKSMFDIL